MNANEEHPLRPFLPNNARILMLGSFPPPQKRWCMEFYYPNFNNDMWRIMGEVFYSDKLHFVCKDKNCFDKDKITAFLNERGIALYDTAAVVKRLNNNASDKFLQIIKPTDIPALLCRLPQCKALVATGQKAAECLSASFQLPLPCIGKPVSFIFKGKSLKVYRMPSSSRAYPIPFQRKADEYRRMFTEEGFMKA